MAAADLSDLKPVYLIYGDEDLLLERAVRRLRSRLAEVADLDFNLETFDGETADADDVIQAANTLPFMSDKRLVIVRNVDKLPSAGLNALADYANDPAESACLVLVARKIARNTRLFKAVDARKGAYEYKAPKRGEYPAHVALMFRERGRTVSADGAELLVRSVGRDLRRLQSEVEKVVAFTGQRTSLTREDVEAVISSTAPVSVFDLTDAVGARDCRGALRLLADLVGQGESVHGLHAMVVRHVRMLLSARALLDRGLPASALVREIGMAEWQARKVAQQAGRFSAEDLVAALRRAAEAELRMKTSQADARLVLERWIVGVCEAD
jgi:DNA polymerase-3 subunit delta